MADAATQAPDQSTDIASLTGGLPPTGSSAIADLTKLKKQQIGEETKVLDKTDRTIDRDQARVEKAFAAEGVETDALKPWNANKEHEKFESDPIQGIGSVGSIFAVIASAFTKAPATNAIEGMAGAINAIKEGNEAAYNRAFESYKLNTKLALDRQKLQHEQYQDATSLMATNMAAGEAKMHNLAAKFGDQNTLMLLEHGMSKELFEMQSARVDAAEKWAQYSENLDKRHFQKLAIDEIKKNPPNTGNPVQDKMQMAAQIQRIYDGNGKYGTAEQEAVGRYVMAHQNDPADKFADGLAEVHQQFSAKAPNIEGYQNAKQSWTDQHPGETIPADEDAKLLQQFGLATQPRVGAAGGAVTTNKIEAEEIKRRAADYVAGGMEPAVAFDKAMKEVKTAERKPDQPKAPTENNVIAQEISKRASDYVADGMDPHEAFDKALKEVTAASAKPGTGASGTLTNDRVINKDAEEHKAQMKKDHPDWSSEKLDQERDAYVKQRKVATATPSGNRVDDLQGKIDQTDNIIRESKENLDFLHKFKGGAGLMGKLMRGEEIVGNIAGTTDTERVAFRRRVHELQEMVPRIITDSNGRPLKAAQDKVDDFVAGLSAGDTGPNTIRAYEDLIAEMQKRQGDYKSRKSGGGSATSGAAEQTGDTNWLDAYPVKN